MLATRMLKLGLCGLLLTACGGKEAPAAEPPAIAPAGPAPEAKPAPVAEAPKEPAKPVIEDTTFRLALEADPTYGEGKEGKFRLVLTALGGYHVNPDYPIHVDLKGPAALKLAKASLGKPDAAEFGEHAARFDVSFTAPKGNYAVEADVDFAVCTKETCVPDQRKLALNLQVM